MRLDVDSGHVAQLSACLTRWSVAAARTVTSLVRSYDSAFASRSMRATTFGFRCEKLRCVTFCLTETFELDGQRLNGTLQPIKPRIEGVENLNVATLQLFPAKP